MNTLSLKQWKVTFIELQNINTKLKRMDITAVGNSNFTKFNYLKKYQMYFHLG